VRFSHDDVAGILDVVSHRGVVSIQGQSLDLSQIESGHSFGGSLDLVEERCGVPGIGFMPQLDSVMGMLTVRRWLVVSILMLMNIALWWYYRQPKEVTPCES